MPKNANVICEGSLILLGVQKFYNSGVPIQTSSDFADAGNAEPGASMKLRAFVTCIQVTPAVANK